MKHTKAELMAALYQSIIDQKSLQVKMQFLYRWFIEGYDVELDEDQKIQIAQYLRISDKSYQKAVRELHVLMHSYERLFQVRQDALHLLYQENLISERINS